MMDTPEHTNPGNVDVAHWKPGITFGEFSELKFAQFTHVQ